MTTPRTTGRAGKYSRQMQMRSYLHAFGWASAAASAGAAALLLLTRQSYPWALALAVAAAVCATTAHHHLGRAGKQNIGANSEQQVAAALARTDAFHIINNAALPGCRGDCDHVVLTARGCAVVETKSGGGQVRITADGKLVTGQGRVVPGDPVGQALAQAGGLARLLGGEHVTAIVCVPRLKNRPIRSGGACADRIRR